MKKKFAELETNYDFDSYAWILKCLKLLPKFIITRHFHQVTYKYKRGEMVELRIINLLDLEATFIAEFSSKQFDMIENSDKLAKSLDSFAESWRNQTFSIVNSLYREKKIVSSPNTKLLIVSSFFYSRKNQIEIFEPVASDWQEEYFEALFKKEIWKSRWINARYTYAFLVAMWQKSPIGDLIEFISKIAK
jgi:hypothetical protein